MSELLFINMKKILFLVLFLALGSCKDCDGKRYQIRMKVEIGNNMCQYKAVSLGGCFTWQDSNEILFVDRCNAFELSQVVKSEIVKKY